MYTGLQAFCAFALELIRAKLSVANDTTTQRQFQAITEYVGACLRACQLHVTPFQLPAISVQLHVTPFQLPAVSDPVACQSNAAASHLGGAQGIPHPVPPSTHTRTHPHTLLQYMTTDGIWDQLAGIENKVLLVGGAGDELVPAQNLRLLVPHLR